MKIATPPSPVSPADLAIRLGSAIAASWLALTVWPMLGWTLAHGEALPLALHVAALLAALACAAPLRWVPRVVRDWMPLALGPFLYIELRWLIEGAGRPHADATVIAWERAVFASDPSRTWAPAFPHLALSELLHLCYASYYLLVLIPPVVLYARGRRDDYARTVLALAMVYAACFATYLLFPVDGPRYLLGAAAAPDGAVRSFVLRLLAAGSSRGTAFPSSHVAASLVAALCALRADRRLGLPLLAVTGGLTLATVYGGFHYGVDVLGGLVTAGATWMLSGMLWRRLSRRTVAPSSGTQSATAAW